METALWHLGAHGVLVQRGTEPGVLLDPRTGASRWTAACPLVRTPIAVAPDGARFAFTEDAASTEIVVVDAAQGAELAHGRLRASPNVVNLAFAPDGRTLAWTVHAPPYDYGAVNVWTPGDPGSVRRVADETGRTSTVGFLADGAHVVFECDAGREVYSLATMTRVASLGWGAGETLVALPGTSEMLAVGVHGDVAHLDALAGVTRRVFKAPRNLSRAVVSPEHRRIAWLPPDYDPPAETAPEWCAIDHADAPPVAIAPPPEDAWRQGAWLHRTPRLALRTARAVFVLDFATGGLAQRFRCDDPDDAVSALAVGPDDTLVCGTRMGRVVALD